MNTIYNIAVNAANGGVRLYSKCISSHCSRKFPLFAMAQQGLVGRIEREMAEDVRQGVSTVWFHCASLGEYAVARPLIARLKELEPTCRVVLTFFSPSGYRALEHRHPNIDHLFYLPLDTRSNAKAFLRAVRPDKAVFVISEYWPNYLQQLKFNAIPTYLVSAIIRDDSQFFKWYGKIYRKSLSAFSRIFVLNESSKFNLRMLGYTDAEVCGDPLFDNAALIARTPWTDPVIERFCTGRQVFIAGSISDEKDLALVNSLANRHRDVKFIYVPHDITTSALEQIERTVESGATLRYSQCTPSTEALDTAQVLIVDTIGKLAYLYRYGTWAYVGGGFTPLLHSVLEATVYGLPVAFGPMINRKVTPEQLIELGIGAKVTDEAEICRWFSDLLARPERLEEIRAAARAYVDRNLGATAEIVGAITTNLTPRSDSDLCQPD